MEDVIINKIKKNKKRLHKLYVNIMKNEVDIKSLDMIDSNTLLRLEIITRIDEELTDIIYMILDNKNS